MSYSMCLRGVRSMPLSKGDDAAKGTKEATLELSGASVADDPFHTYAYGQDAFF